MAGVAAGCSEQPLVTEPSVAPMAAVAANTMAANAFTEAVADAVERIAPALGNSPAAADARGTLRMLQARLAAADGAGVGGALPAVETALDRLERAEPGLAAEVDAIRLAIAQQ